MDKAQVIESLKSAYLMLEGAEKALDMKRGEGYAEAHPEIVAAFTLSIALDCHARATSAKLDDFTEALARSDATDALVDIGAKIIDAITLNGVDHLGGVQ